MHVCGIIAEYDPFHTGHAHQIKAARKILGSDSAVVCVMSGNWTQRGGPAIVSKHLRAKLALMGGADLVLELPLPYAVSSAEWFARGGIATLNATGVVTHLCFGSEAGTIDPLQSTAVCLDSEEYRFALHTHLDKGLSYPVARQKATVQLIGVDADCLSYPNNNLGVEYLRALSWCNSEITPITILRQGAGHGEPPQDGFSSASHIRRLMRNDNWDELLPYLIPGEAELLANSDLADISHAERAFLCRLRSMSEPELAALPDCGEGLSNRLFRSIQTCTSLEEILLQTKTKRYTLARLRRILTCAYLGLSSNDRPHLPAYIRVLGMNETGQTLLRIMRKTSTLPLLTKPAHIHRMSAEAQHLFELECNATDLYGLCLPSVSKCGTEWTQSPMIF